ncbi:MAG: polymerase alpha subunit [Pseudomonadota bacterium]|jgi:error-prone DNA polymerase
MLPDYAELHCASNFSFLHGASHPEEFVDRAIALGYTALAITDECSLAGVVRAHVACRGKALKLIIGTEVQLTDGPRLVLLACSRRGYGRLAALITQARRAAPKGEYQLFCADLESGLEECLALYVSQGAPDRAALAWLAARFPGRAALAVSLTRGADDAQHLAQSIAAADEAGIPAVAATGALMHVRARHRLQQVLTAIRLNRTLAECGHALTVNAERHLRSRAVLADLYPPALLANAVALAARCQFSLDELRYEYPDEIVPAGSSPASALRALCEEGYTRRLDEIRRLGLDVSARAASLRDQIEHEISLIAELRFEAYFLTVHDIVRFARSRGILCQGRGSAANSAVCYALGITEVDPWRATMLFERFISKERNEPPDIDVDFEHHRREEVIQYLYQKYGRDRAALTAALITYRPKSALRDVGRALGFEPSRLDELNRNLAAWDGRHIHPERLGEMGFEVNSPQVKCWVELANALIGFPRHLSQHPGGFVISRGPLCELVPIENAAMEARTLIQWDKDDLDALGLLKVDVLALGMLSAIAKALALVGARRGAHFGMGDIPPEDSRVYDMISRADTMGVFQIESRAQMSMLPRLQPRCYYDLVIEVAIVRPGPIQGGMVHPYLRRRQGQEAVTYPSEAVRGVLSRTLGVPVFQEQVMQLAMVAAGFSAGQADQLRRAMAAWKRRGGLEPFEKQLIEGMLARGYSRDFAQSLFAQIAGFGEYGFPESHAASFALLVYVSAWLKCHEPAAFLCALLNSQPMGFYGPSQLIQDARRHGVEVRGVDVLESDWDCTLEGDAARLGLCMIAGLSQEAALRLVAARKKPPLPRCKTWRDARALTHAPSPCSRKPARSWGSPAIVGRPIGTPAAPSPCLG